jgi:AcrR family transcriptional regulator
MPAGRPPDPELLERLLDVATDLFYRKGINGVGVDEIAAAAKVAKRSLYRHFKTKDALVRAVIRRRGQRFRSEFFSAVQRRAATPRSQLLAAFDLLKATCRSKGFRGCPFINAAVDLADPTHAAHLAVREHKLAIRAFFEDLLRRAGVPNPANTAGLLMVLFDGALVGCAIAGSDGPAISAQNAVRRMLK